MIPLGLCVCQNVLPEECRDTFAYISNKSGGMMADMARSRNGMREWGRGDGMTYPRTGKDC